jgi:DNA-binding XRE family transcriptional regulator
VRQRARVKEHRNGLFAESFQTSRASHSFAAHQKIRQSFFLYTPQAATRLLRKWKNFLDTKKPQNMPQFDAILFARILRASAICPQIAGMEKSVFTPLYDVFRTKLVEMRTSAKLTQRQLAKNLQRERSFVSRIELGERRLDFVEFYWVCRACGFDPDMVATELIEDFEKIEKRKRL